MIPIHPQPCPGRPGSLRWITPAGVLPFTGPAAAVPAPLAALLADGTLAQVLLEPAAVETRLGPGGDWAHDGARVRTALHAALADRDGWAPAAGSEGGNDEALRSAAEDLLAGDLGRFAASHGGGIALLDVSEGVVTVRLDGACHGCPAARQTLGRRFEEGLRRRCPQLRAVVAGN
ncbi:NifU family protein [Actinoplanes sp. CA-030573]|uniref:NifU family protein n=1 Tax=Actinoplanes sp. CA-030573 TaxID=3239898 RepID=UPI003D9487F5